MRVTIVGSGIMGLFSAYYLQKSGFSVTVLERENGPSGASSGNAGMIVPSHFIPLAAPGVLWQAFKWMFKSGSPFALSSSINMELLKWGYHFLKSSYADDLEKKSEVLLSLNLESRRLHEEIIRNEHLEVGFRPDGLAMLCKTQKALDHERKIADIASKMQLPVYEPSLEQLDSLHNSIELDIKGGIVYPFDAFLSPGLYLERLKSLLIKRGVVFLSDKKDIQLQRTGKIVRVIIDKEILPGDEVIITAGMGSVDLVKEIGLNLPMVSGKGYSFMYDGPLPRPGICGILTEARVAYTPMPNGIRFGGTMEIGGKSGILHQNRIQGIQKSISDYMPEYKSVDFSTNAVWSGLRPVSPDGLPYIGRPVGYNNLIISTGHAMMGLSLGAVTGKMVSRLAGGIEITHQEFLKVDRFN